MLDSLEVRAPIKKRLLEQAKSFDLDEISPIALLLG